jgi:hypothetical protein
MQRACGAGALEAARLAVQMGKPLWCDWDDHMFAVLRSNPLYCEETYPQECETVKEIASLATIITVTTPILKDVFKEYNPNTLIIPNAVDPTLYATFKQPPKRKHSKIVYWRGSPSHIENLLRYAPMIKQVAEQNLDVHFVFHGMDPYFIQLPKHQYTFIKPSRIPDCFITEMEIQPDVHMVCLNDTPFDRARSNIAWMEGTMANTLVVAPKWYLPAGYVGIGFDFHEFPDKLKQALYMSNEDKEDIICKAQNKIHTVNLISMANDVRLNKVIHPLFELSLEGFIELKLHSL